MSKSNIKNSYQDVYDRLNIKINAQTTPQEAEQIIRHLGLLYNTLGNVMKDVTKLLSLKYPFNHEIVDEA